MRSKWIWPIILAIAVGLVGIRFYTARLSQYGLSTRDKPSALEAYMALGFRRGAIPAGARALKNPVPPAAEMLVQGRNHWADHCAICHANNGAGDTEIGRSLYPQTPDMRRPETQSLSDGELYYIIRNGVRMTGMPAWGNPEKGNFDHETWMLVLFIRHLPQLTVDEEKAMKAFNPKSTTEREEEEQEEDFLNGKPPKEGTHDH